MDSDFISFESMIAAKEAARWSYWTMIGAWVSGIATSSAVVTSLYLANRRVHPKIRASVSIGFSLEQPSAGYGVLIDISNIGHQTVIVRGFSWDFGSGHRYPGGGNLPGDMLPRKIECGELFSYRPSSESASKWVERVKQSTEKSGGDFRKAKLLIYLSTGDVEKIKPDKEIMALYHK